MKVKITAVGLELGVIGFVIASNLLFWSVGVK